MEKDENKTPQVITQDKQSTSGPLKYFSSDSNFVFILKKTEKLSSALYLITGFFEDREPIKWKLRNLSGQLLSASLSLKDAFSSKKEKAILDMQTIVLEVSSLLLVAKHAGLISEMNYNIINKEFSVFADSLVLGNDAFDKKGAGNIKAEFFNVPVAAPKVEKLDSPTAQRNITGIKDNVFEDEAKTDTHKVETEIVLDKQGIAMGVEKGQKLDEGMLARMGQHRTLKETQTLKEFGAVAVKKNSRQSVIISLLRRKREIMIKDVSPLIDGCSEKTIQRELLAMVKKGILKKKGEKRWSKYSLA